MLNEEGDTPRFDSLGPVKSYLRQLVMEKDVELKELRPLADMSQVYVPPNDEYKIRVGPQKFNGALQPERYMVALGLSENLVRVVSCIPAPMTGAVRHCRLKTSRKARPAKPQGQGP
jgi:hypothetical protein